MRPRPHAVLVHSPLTTAAAWGELPAALRDRGWTVTVPDVVDDDEPHASRFVALTALQLARSGVTDNVVLIGHGEAGPLLPQLAFARHSAGSPVSGYVFVNALLPRTLRTGTLLDLWEASNPVVAAELAQQLSNGGAHPDLSDTDLTDTLHDPSDRAALLDSLRPRHLDFFTERLPLTEDWPDAPCAYAQLTSDYAPEARTAQLRGWPVRSVDAHHFWALTNPDELADVLTDLDPA